MKINLKTGRFVKEQWKDVVVDREEKDTYKGLYQVSNLGRVRSLYKNKLLKQCDDGYGYCIVNLVKNGKSKKYKIHRLVALAFISNPENKSYVDHINTDRKNNTILNLRWATREENNNNELTRKHISNSKKGKPSYWKGKTFSEEYKKKLSDSHKGKMVGKYHHSSKKVICVTTGEIFESSWLGAKHYNMANHIIDNCKGKRNQCGKLSDGKPLIWMYYEDYIKKQLKGGDE